MKYTQMLLPVFFAVLLTACAEPPTSTPTQASPAVSAPLYICPMHPHYHSTNPDGQCPVCGMALTATGNNSNKHDGIDVAAHIIQSMGVRTALVKKVEFGRELRAFGTVESNERLESVAVSRLEGWVKDLKARAEGDTVRPGSLLYRVYSADLLGAQKDYLSAREIGNEKRVAAVAQRLRSLGMQEAVIDQLRERSEVQELLPVYAEAGGTVVELAIREGDYIKPGTPILRLQSYADVWVIARIPEQDLSLIDTGLDVRLSFPSAPDAPARGVVDYVYPTIDPQTRTGEMRIEVDNTTGRLRPGAYADITLQVSSGPRLAIPTEAVLRDSRGAHVIVALGNGRFAPRAIVAGVDNDEQTQVIQGLKHGEQVVASGQFMLDSEVKLQEGLGKLQPRAGN